MSNFDLKKFLAEGKLHEEITSTEETMDKSSTKMKMSELKKKIRQEILAELDGAETEGPDGENVDPVAEATKDGDGEVPSKDTDTDIDIEDKEEVKVDVEKKPKMSGPSNKFLDQLEVLKREADAMGDNKLERQIDNTITYFTRQHIAKDIDESIELEEADRDYYDAAERDDASHIAALEKDMEDDKKSALNEAKEDEVPLTSKVKSFINKAISDAKKDGKFEDLKKADWFENELIDMLIELFEDKDYDRASKEVKDYIKTKTAMNESLEILRMKKLAGLITEGEYAKALLRENIEQDIATAAKPKIKDLMLEPRTEMIDGVLHIDFDDIGTLWSEVFEEVFKREMDDLIDQDVDDFEKVQNIVMDMITNNGEIEFEFDY
jgi:hypothetical protein